MAGSSSEDSISLPLEDDFADFLNILEQDDLKIEVISDDGVDLIFSPFINEEGEENSSSSGDEIQCEPFLLDDFPVQQGNNTWNVSDEFTPLPAAPPIKEEGKSVNLVKPLDIFHRYIPEKVISDLAFATSQRISSKTGSDVTVTTQTMKQFIGINVIMSYIRYPRIRMYWAAKTCVSQIADKMSRELFCKIRSHLTCREYSTVSKEEKKRNLFWKINPIVECVRNACLTNPRSENISIYRQIIPLHSEMKKKSERSKPNTKVLTNVVSSASDGLPLDFYLYQGVEVDVDPKLELDLGAKIVLKLSQSLPPGCNVYLNQYFTSLTVMEALFPMGIHCTGVLKKQEIPDDCDFGPDSDLRSRGRGSFIQLVRDDGQYSVVKWFDKKVMVIASNVHGALPLGVSAHWKKSRNAYIHVNIPNVVSHYIKNMHGAEFFEQMIDRYRISAKSINWTVKTIFHLIDFAIVAGFIERRRIDSKRVGEDQMELIDFKVEVAYGLLHCSSDTGNICLEVDVEREALAQTFGMAHKRRIVPLPNDSVRYSGAFHLPEKPVGAKLSRCRMPGCHNSKCRFWCKTCKVFLCLTSTRNCFKKFHEL